MRKTLSGLMFAILATLALHAPAQAADVICYNCPPQWADFATMLTPRKKLRREAQPDTRKASIVIPNWNGRDLLEKYLPSVLAAAQTAHDETLAYVRSPVGDIASPIQSFFALVADDPSVQIVNSAQSWYVKRLAATMPALRR